MIKKKSDFISFKNNIKNLLHLDTNNFDSNLSSLLINSNNNIIKSK